MSLFINKAHSEGINQGWMYILGVLFAFIGGQLLGAIPLATIILMKGRFDIETISNPDALGIDRNLFLVLNLLPFIVSFIILWIFIKFLHKKRFHVSLTAFEKFDWKKLSFAFFVWFIMSGAFDLFYYFSNPANYEFHTIKFPSFLILVLISLLLIPIQTTFEELLFRSYLMQGLGMWTSIKIAPKFLRRFFNRKVIHWKARRMFPLLITSTVFGLIHIANPEIKEYGYLVLIQYISIGFLLGMLTLLSDSMEFSIGVHAANNIYGCLFVSFKGSALSTDSLFYAKEMTVDWTTILLYISILIIFFLIINYRYKLLPLSVLWKKFELSENQ